MDKFRNVGIDGVDRLELEEVNGNEESEKCTTSLANSGLNKHSKPIGYA